MRLFQLVILFGQLFHIHLAVRELSGQLTSGGVELFQFRFILMNTMFMGLSSLIFIYPAAPPHIMPNLCGIIAIHGHGSIVERCQQVLLDVPNLSAVFF